MKLVSNKYYIIIIVVFLILTIWYTANNRENNYSKNPVLPETSIASLPEDIEKTIGTITDRVGKEDVNGLFTLLNRNRISGNIPLVFQTYYKKSDRTREYVTGMPSSFAGLTIEQLEEVLREWDIREYEPDKSLVLYRIKDELTPEDKNNQHLGIKDGKVVIFYGKKDQKGNKVVKKETDINIDKLPEKERLKLIDGIEIKSDEELFTILEGLLSYEQD